MIEPYALQIFLAPFSVFLFPFSFPHASGVARVRCTALAPRGSPHPKKNGLEFIVVDHYVPVAVVRAAFGHVRARSGEGSVVRAAFGHVRARSG